MGGGVRKEVGPAEKLAGYVSGEQIDFLNNLFKHEVEIYIDFG